jgi:hypothetical protein
MSAAHTHPHPHPHPVEPHNTGAGQGPVLLDVGADVGALVVRMPAQLDGAEVEICPLPCPPGARLRHVGVLARPTPNGPVHSAVFGGLLAGEYELYVRPDGPVQLTVEVRAAEVTFADWPS